MSQRMIDPVLAGQDENLLEGAVAYLAGPIDRVSDLGVGYRLALKKGAKERDVKVVWIDPTDKFKGLKQEVGCEKILADDLRKNHDWEGLRNFVQEIVRIDLRSVDISDFIVVYVDPEVHMCGTYHELIVSLLQKKPVFAIIKGGKEKAPGWLFGIIHYDYMFDSIDQFLDHLQGLDKGLIPLDDKWVLMRKQMGELLKEIKNGE